MGRKSNVPSLRREKHTLLRKMMWTFDSKPLQIHAYINISYVYISAVLRSYS